MVRSNNEETTQFKEMLVAAGADPDAAADDSVPEVVSQKLYIYTIFRGTAETADVAKWELLAEATSQSSSALPYSLLQGRPNAAFLLTTLYECFLWYTKGCSQDLRESAKADAAAVHRAAVYLTEVEEGAEPTFFKSRFTGWPEPLPPPPADNAPAPPTAPTAAEPGSAAAAADDITAAHHHSSALFDSQAAPAAAARPQSLRKSSRSSERASSVSAQQLAPGRARSDKRRPRAPPGYSGFGAGHGEGYLPVLPVRQQDPATVAAAAAAALAPQPAAAAARRSRSGSSGHTQASAAATAAASAAAASAGAHSWRPQRQGTGRMKRAEDWFAEDMGGVGGSGGSEGGTEAEPLITLSLRGIQAEVQRSMLSADVGTPALLAAGCGDPSDTSLQMQRALGAKGYVRQWQVDASTPDWRKLMGMAQPRLDLKKVPSARVGVLTSGDAYVISYTNAILVVEEEDGDAPQQLQHVSAEPVTPPLQPVAAGAAADTGSSSSRSPVKGDSVQTRVCVETVLYLWIGQDYKHTQELRDTMKRDETGSLLSGILEAGNISAHRVTKVIVEQGREPPYLLALLSAGGSSGAIILTGTCNPRRRSEARAARAKAAAAAGASGGRSGGRAHSNGGSGRASSPLPSSASAAAGVSPTPTSGSPQQNGGSPLRTRGVSSSSVARFAAAGPASSSSANSGSSSGSAGGANAAAVAFGGSPTAGVANKNGLSSSSRPARVFEIMEVPRYPFLESSALVCVEGDLSTAAAGLHPHKTYIVLSGPRSSTQSYHGMWVWHAADESPRTEEFVNHIVRNSRLLFLPGRRQKTPVSLMRGYVSHLVPEYAVPDDFWEVLGANPHDPPLESEDTPRWRAVRLWQVDYNSAKEDSLKVALTDPRDCAHWRPYVREVGPLCVFTQRDLSPKHSYILDSGSVAVFVWHGEKSPVKARELAVRCAKAYTATTLTGVDTSRIDYPVLFQHESGQESLEFMGHFRGWVIQPPAAATTAAGAATTAAGATPPIAAAAAGAGAAVAPIEPYELKDEDYQDVKAAEDALLRAIQGTRLARPPSMPRLSSSSTSASSGSSRAGGGAETGTLRAKRASARGSKSRGSSVSKSPTRVSTGGGSSSSRAATTAKVGPAHTAAAAALLGLNGGSSSSDAGTGEDRADAGDDEEEDYDASNEKIIRAAVYSLAAAAAPALAASPSSSGSGSGSGSPSSAASTAATAGRSTLYKVKVEDLGTAAAGYDGDDAASSSGDVPAGERWECHRSLDDFLALFFMLKSECKGMRNQFPHSKELAGWQSPSSSPTSSPRRDSAAAAAASSDGSESAAHLEAVERLSRWLQELLEGAHPLRLRSRYRLYSFLGVTGLEALAKAAGAESDDQMHMTSQTYRMHLPASGLFFPLRAELEEVDKSVEAERAALMYKLQELEKRSEFAGAQKDEEKRKASALRKEVDSLFKRRKKLRNALYAQLKEAGAADPDGTAAAAAAGAVSPSPTAAGAAGAAAGDQRGRTGRRSSASDAADDAAAAAALGARSSSSVNRFTAAGQQQRRLPPTAAAAELRRVKSAQNMRAPPPPVAVGPQTPNRSESSASAEQAPASPVTPTRRTSVFNRMRGLFSSGSSKDVRRARSATPSRGGSLNKSPLPAGELTAAASLTPTGKSAKSLAGASGAITAGAIGATGAASAVPVSAMDFEQFKQALKEQKAELQSVEAVYTAQRKKLAEHAARIDKLDAAVSDAEAAMLPPTAALKALAARVEAHVDGYMARLATGPSARARGNDVVSPPPGRGWWGSDSERGPLTWG